MPGASRLPDDPTIAHDGGIALTPLLMRFPLPGAGAGLRPHEWLTVRKQLRRAAEAVELEVARAGRLPMGPTCAAALVIKCPQLMLVSPVYIASSYGALRAMLKASPTRLAVMLARCPSLLLLPASSLQDTWSCLQQELGLPGQVLASRLLQQPQLLRLSGQDVQLRMQHLGGALGWHEGLVRRMLQNQVQLLGASPTSVLAKISTLAEALGVSEPAAHAMAQRQPALLTLSSSTLRRNLQGLHDVLQPIGGWPPGPLSWPSDTASEGEGSSQAGTCLCHPSVARVVEAQPTLLTLPPQTLAKKMGFIASMLKIEPRYTCIAFFYLTCLMQYAVPI